MSRLRSGHARPEGRNQLYRESVIDPQAKSTTSADYNVPFTAGQSARSAFRRPYHNSTNSASGNVLLHSNTQKVQHQSLVTSDALTGTMDVKHSSFLPSDEQERSLLPTLDDIDVEALILSYKPILHPSVREGLEDQYSVIEAARRERETRLDIHMSRSQSSASTQSQADVGSILPSYTGRSFEERSSSRASTSSPTKSILKKSHGSSSSHSKTNFLSGEIPSEDSANAYLQYIQPANILRRPSQATRNHPDQSNERLRIATPPIAGTSFVTGSIDLAPSSTRTSSFTSRSPLSSPPIPALPSRFTRTTSPSAGPGSTYRNAEPNPFFAQRSFVRTASAEMSPRSSLSSSKSNQSSLRWSSESCKTASTSRSISQPVLLSEVLEIKHKSPQDTSRSLQTKIDENDEGPKPPAFSWLSFDEDEVNVSENFPPVQRKNSLWRESLDSTTSSHFDLLEDKEDIRARHFPTPPPMSRSNSVATTMTPESEKRDPLKPTEEDSHVQGTPYQQNQLPDTSRPSKQPPTSSSKASVSEMLRVHLASPLRRNKSPRSGESRDGDLTDRKNRQPFRSGSSSNSSSTTVTNRV